MKEQKIICVDIVPRILNRLLRLEYQLDDQGSIPDRNRGFFSSPPRPDRLCGPPSLLSNG